MINKVILTGYLANDPESRGTPEKPVTKLRMAIRRGQYTNFINVTTFGDLATRCKEYLSKGRYPTVEGFLKENNWEDSEGKKHWTTEVRATSVDFGPQVKNSDNE